MERNVKRARTIITVRAAVVRFSVASRIGTVTTAPTSQPAPTGGRNSAICRRPNEDHRPRWTSVVARARTDVRPRTERPSTSRQIPSHRRRPRTVRIAHTRCIPCVYESVVVIVVLDFSVFVVYALVFLFFCHNNYRHRRLINLSRDRSIIMYRATRDVRSPCRRRSAATASYQRWRRFSRWKSISPQPPNAHCFNVVPRGFCRYKQQYNRLTCSY